MTDFQLVWVNRDGCHMFDRKCSLFPQRLIFTASGELMILLIRYTYALCITVLLYY